MHADSQDFSVQGNQPHAIEQKAADWLVLHDRGLNLAQQQEFESWMQINELHAKVYADLAKTWDLIGRVRKTAPAHRLVPEAAIRTFPWRRPALWLTAAAALGLALFIVKPTADPSPDFILTASTEVGGLRKLPLPDGSMIQLNTDSAIEVRFTTNERSVKLIRGEAHFQVAKNPARPFVVNAGALNVRAVGTAFDVRRRPQAVEILVTEGKVRVDDSAGGASLLPHAAANNGHTFLVAGERVYVPVGVVAAPVQVVAVAPVKIGQMLAWQSHRLEFIATPLSEIVAEFNRYNRHKLVIADSRLAARRFGGSFPAGDYEEFVRLLETDFGILAERDRDEIRLKLAP